MPSLAVDFLVLAGLLALLAYLFLSTLGVNRNRRIRSIKRKIADRLLSSWK